MTDSSASSTSEATSEAISAATSEAMSAATSEAMSAASSAASREAPEDAARRQAAGLSRSCFPGGALPLVASPVGRGDAASVPALAAEIRACAEEALPRHGAVLFRGFPVRSTADFHAFVRLVTPELLDYTFGSTPRSHVQDRIYTSTEYPAHQHIPLHNEQSYTLDWPLKIWFHCAAAAPEGGSTPLADSREVFRRIPARIRERFAAKRVMYVRNYGNGLDLPWQKVFGTNDRAEVERFCRAAGIACEWKADGELRTRQVCQAVATHPRTGEHVWFNQAHLFHVSNLDPATREALLSIFTEQDLPRNALYGDGSPIEGAALDEIRDVYRQLAVEFAWREGDVLLADNMLVAHGRAPFRGPRKVLVAMAEPYRAKAS
ncbi:TauD/TfdA family dioxygenase [Sorangium sp. So ce388]|uniref:TauD/TfdA family dioxygenase n=1 Tax=Sorangium sp. So ce388 TaxID=3133309 RepID=UPI003F5B7D94